MIYPTRRRGSDTAHTHDTQMGRPTHEAPTGQPRDGRCLCWGRPICVSCVCAVSAPLRRVIIYVLCVDTHTVCGHMCITCAHSSPPRGCHSVMPASVYAVVKSENIYSTTRLVCYRNPHISPILSVCLSVCLSVRKTRITVLYMFSEILQQRRRSGMTL